MSAPQPKRPGRTALTFLSAAAVLFLFLRVYGSTHPDDMPTNIICWSTFALWTICLLAGAAFTSVWEGRRYLARRALR